MGFYVGDAPVISFIRSEFYNSSFSQCIPEQWANKIVGKTECKPSIESFKSMECKFCGAPTKENKFCDYCGC